MPGGRVRRTPGRHGRTPVAGTGIPGQRLILPILKILVRTALASGLHGGVGVGRGLGFPLTPESAGRRAFASPRYALYLGRLSRGVREAEKTKRNMPGQEEKIRGVPLNFYEPQPRVGKNHLLVIGIDKYESMPVLDNSVLDAKTVAGLLIEKYQFDVGNLVTLFDEYATQQAIINAFETLADTVTNEDTLVVYFAGHGEYDKKFDVGYWIPVDARRGQIGTYISFDLVTRMVRSIKSHHTFVLSDSCFSGSFFSMQRSISEPAIARLEATPSRWLLTSGRKEPVSDGIRGQHSPFALAVIKELQRNKEPFILVSDFINKVRIIVGNNSEQLPEGGQ